MESSLVEFWSWATDVAPRVLPGVLGYIGTGTLWELYKHWRRKSVLSVQVHPVEGPFTVRNGEIDRSDATIAGIEVVVVNTGSMPTTVTGVLGRYVRPWDWLPWRASVEFGVEDYNGSSVDTKVSPGEQWRVIIRSSYLLGFISQSRGALSLGVRHSLLSRPVLRRVRFDPGGPVRLEM